MAALAAAQANPTTFQRGGIVTSPTLAMVGEAGPEAIIPLTGGGRAGMGGNTIINNKITVQGSVLTERELTDLIDRHLYETLSRITQS